eukprot:scaffold139040_cov59-Attheya_sp.AAC.1
MFSQNWLSSCNQDTHWTWVQPGDVGAGRLGLPKQRTFPVVGWRLFRASTKMLHSTSATFSGNIFSYVATFCKRILRMALTSV